MNIFVFDIETVPDVAGAARCMGLSDTPDAQVYEAYTHLCREKRQSEFWPHHLQKIICISVVLHSGDKFAVWSLGSVESAEAELLQRFYHGLSRYTPTLVSWNGTGFDCPVIHYRSLHHNIDAAQYWETGEHDAQFRWNNYLNRYHNRHCDLMDVLAGYMPRCYAPLDEVAALCGFPGKMGMAGNQVRDCYLAGDIAAIRHYCETDVLNTYLLYLRYEYMRGNITQSGLKNFQHQLRNYLAHENLPHFTQFLANWPEA